MTPCTDAVITFTCFAMIEGVREANGWGRAGSIGALDDFDSLIQVPISKSATWASLCLAIKLCCYLNGAGMLNQ